jgi:tripartite-type tricarboxylate transporter receptor subunit TctC
MLQRGFVFLILLLLASAPALAQPAAEAFPVRPVRIVVGFPPGGSSDVSARLVAERMSEEWKQPVIIDNKAGAGGTIAAAFVAAAPADGYTLLHVGPGTHAITSVLYKDLSYDALKSFAGVGQIAVAPFVVVVNASSSVKSMKELLELARAKPGQVSYGSTGSGAGPNVVTEIIALATGVKFLHVPFKGAAPATAAALGGQVDFAMADSASAIAHVQSGKLRALAVTTAQPSPLYLGRVPRARGHAARGDPPDQCRARPRARQRNGARPPERPGLRCGADDAGRVRRLHGGRGAQVHENRQGPGPAPQLARVSRPA